MTDIQKKMMEKLGLKKEDFEKKPNETNTRLSDIEDALIELAEIIEEQTNG